MSQLKLNPCIAHGKDFVHQANQPCDPEINRFKTRTYFPKVSTSFAKIWLVRPSLEYTFLRVPSWLGLYTWLGFHCLFGLKKYFYLLRTSKTDFNTEFCMPIVTYFGPKLVGYANYDGKETSKYILY